MDNAMRPDWSAIRREREESGLSYRKLAEKFGVTAAAVEKRAQREKWTPRAMAVAKTVAQLIPTATSLERARERVADQAVQTVAGFLSEAVRQAVSMMAHGERLALAAENPREFRDASAGWALVHEGGRKAHGLDRQEISSGLPWRSGRLELTIEVDPHPSEHR